MKTPMKHCYSKSYSPESSLDYERQVMLQRCFVVVFAVSEFVGICIVSAARSLIVSAARSLTCRDDLDSKWRLLLAENELSRVSLLSQISIGN